MLSFVLLRDWLVRLERDRSRSTFGNQRLAENLLIPNNHRTDIDDRNHWDIGDEIIQAKIRHLEDSEDGCVGTAMVGQFITPNSVPAGR
jgi:hypothetical protein